MYRGDTCQIRNIETGVHNTTLEPTLDTTHAGKRAFVIARGTRSVECVVIGHWGEYVRVKLIDRDRCHLSGDEVDYGKDWIDIG